MMDLPSREVQMNDEVTALIEKAIQAIQDKHDTREYKLAITKLQEALM